jgi:putative transcriptional regulator
MSDPPVHTVVETTAFTKRAKSLGLSADDRIEEGVAQMNDQDFKGIVAGLEDAIAFVKGDTSRGRVAAGPDVKAIRAKTKLTQAKFAEKLHIPVATLRDWEQHRRSPDAPARTLLGIVDADPKAAMALIERLAG